MLKHVWAAGYALACEMSLDDAKAHARIRLWRALMAERMEIECAFI